MTIPTPRRVMIRPVRTAPQVTTLSPRAPRSRTATGPTVIQIGELDWRFAHPHPDLLIGMDLESLLGSELMRTLLRGWAGKLGATSKEQDQMLVGLGDAKRILISISNRDILAMIVGKIGNLPVGPQAGGLEFTRLSEDTALMGSEAGSLGALTRLKVAALPNPQQDEPKLMAHTCDFWFWGRADRFAGLSASSTGNAPVNKIKMGVSFRDGFHLR